MAIQFHPEESFDQWNDGSNINQTCDKIAIYRHFADVFVKMAIENPNNFGNFPNSHHLEIWNYPIINTHNADYYVFGG